MEKKVIKLQVGEKTFFTKASTLTKSPFFEALLSGKWKNDPNTENIDFFVDRDGELFVFVMQILRYNKLLSIPSSSLQELRREVDFYLEISDDQWTELLTPFEHRYCKLCQKLVPFTHVSSGTPPAKFLCPIYAKIRRKGVISAGGIELPSCFAEKILYICDNLYHGYNLGYHNLDIMKSERHYK